MMKLLLAAAMAMTVYADVTVTMTGPTSLSNSDKSSIKTALSASAAGTGSVIMSSDITVTDNAGAITAVLTCSGLCNTDNLLEGFCAGTDVIAQGITAFGVAVSDVAVDGCAGGLGVGAIIGIVVAVLAVAGLGFYFYKKQKGEPVFRGRGAPDSGIESVA